MAPITITNADEAPVKKFGEQFEPGESKQVEAEVVVAYSLLEISLALQSIAKNLGRENLRREDETEQVARDRRENRPLSVRLVNQQPYDTGPSRFFVRLWHVIIRRRPRWKLFG